MNFAYLALMTVHCLIVAGPQQDCTRLDPGWLATEQVAGAQASEQKSAAGPQYSGQALDVVLTAQAAYAWDTASGDPLYEKNALARRPVASLSKLLTVLLAARTLDDDAVVTVPEDALRAQRQGAHVGLPIGDHVTVADLLAASVVASANDAAVTLAVATAGSEEAFVHQANAAAPGLGLFNTRLANATGLDGGDQYSTAHDIQRLMTLALRDERVGPLLAQKQGVAASQEGWRRSFQTTNKLLGSYLPIVAAKTGYTAQAGENLVVITRGPQGQEIGAVILGSTNRFQDMKTLVEWIWRNYTWED